MPTIVDSLHLCLDRGGLIDKAFSDIRRSPDLAVNAPVLPAKVMQCPAGMQWMPGTSRTAIFRVVFAAHFIMDAGNPFG